MRKHSILTAFLITAGASEANATIFTFALSGDYVATFKIDSDSTPYQSQSYYNEYSDVLGTFNGVNAVKIVEFFTPAADGGLVISGPTNYLAADGPQLFGGSITAPIFQVGSYALTRSGTGQEISLNISAAAVPEPATWAMLVGGFGLLGTAMRRKTVAVTFT